MELLYWAFEYVSVLSGYLFLMFLWPAVVFGGHLRGKSFTYRFGFCVTVQPVLVSTVVLGLGLFHLLDRQLTAALFYGTFVTMLLYRVLRRSVRTVGQALREQRDIVHFVRRTVRGLFWGLRAHVRPRFLEYAVLVLVLAFGVLYFSYGSSQIHTYGSGDMYAHHSWIYGLIEGRIFADGVYPEAMHCFIYCMNALFGIQVQSILLYLQCAHVAVLLLSAYCLLREIFRWKYTAILTLTLYLTWDVVSADMICSISRLQWTLPLEFGLHTQFLCALFLIRYLKNARQTAWRGRESKYCWDCNLFLFLMSLAASIAIHYYATIMAFLLCVSVAVSVWRRVFCRRYFIPLCCAVLCGCAIAIAPMAGALVSGIPFNYSIRWAVNSMDGEATRKLQEAREEKEPAEQEQQGQREQEERETQGDQNKSGGGRRKGGLSGIYRYGYVQLYGAARAVCILILTGIAVCLEAVGRKRDKHAEGMRIGYVPVIMDSFLFILTYAMPYIGLPELISASRFCSTGHMLVLAAVCVPFDAVICRMACRWSDMVQQGGLALAVLGIYAVAILTGSYRGFLYYELSRYDSAVMVTNSIIEAFPRHSYVLVSPTDELYPVIEYGWHEELLTFVRKCGDEDYTIPAEYVFFFVEKKPILYAQAYFFAGPSWLGREEKYTEIYREEYARIYPTSGVVQGPEVIASEVSETEARKELSNAVNPWLLYTGFETRTIIESKAYQWCQRFMQLHPYEMNVYYEDESFVCYYLMQDTNTPYRLGVK